MSAAGAVQRAFGRTPVYRRAMDRAYSPDSTELQPALAAGIDAGHHCTHVKGRRPERTSSFADAYRRLRSDEIVIARSVATRRSRSRRAPCVPWIASP